MKSKFLALIASIALVHAVHLHAISLDSIPVVGRFCADIIGSSEEENEKSLLEDRLNEQYEYHEERADVKWFIILEECEIEMKKILCRAHEYETQLQETSDHKTRESLKAQLLKEVVYQKSLLYNKDKCSRMIKIYLCLYEAKWSNSTNPLQEIESYLPLKCSWSLYKAKRSVEDQLKRVSKKNLNSEHIIKAIDIEIDSQDINTNCGRMIRQYLIGQKMAVKMRNKQEPKQ